MASILTLFTKDALTKALVILTMILAGVAIYHNSKLETKVAELALEQAKNKIQEQKIAKLSETVAYLEKHSNQVNESTRVLNMRLIELEKSRVSFTQKIVEMKGTNDEIKELLDTKLPDDLKRLLDEAIRP